MKRTILPIAVSLFAIGTAGIAGLSFLEKNAAQKTLEAIRIAKPGTHIDVLRKEFGKEMYELEGLDEVLHYGTVQDPAFCEEKKLFWFYVSTPPCRVIEVYTNKDDLIEYVTWQGL